MTRSPIEVVASPEHGVELRRGHAVTDPVARHWHEEFQFCLITSGNGYLRKRGANLETTSGTLFAVPPGEVHSNDSPEASGCSYRTIFINPANIDWIPRVRAPKWDGFVTSNQQFIDTFEYLFRTLWQGESRLAVDESLGEFLQAAFGQSEPRTPVRRHKGLKRAVDYLTEHFAEDVCLQDLADLVGLSRFHFSREFAAVFGLPPHLYQTQVRVVKAKALLLAGGEIGDVALEVGFADQSHMNRHFKRLTAVTPGHYKRKNVQD